MKQIDGHGLAARDHAGTIGTDERIGWLPWECGFALLLVAALAIEGVVIGAGSAVLWIVLIASLFPIISVVALSGFERLFPPAGPRKSLRSWLLHLQINTFFSVMAGIVNVAAFVGLSAAARHYGIRLGLIDIRIATGKGVVMLVASLWLASIISDFFFYWYHRWTHENAFLWQHHKMHHTDRELEAISTARQNWIETWFNAIFIALPVIFLFKVDPYDQWSTGIRAGATASFVHNFLTLSHMNVRWQAGWFSRLWCSPQVHRIHHSLQPEHFDKNYAFVFPMWDVLFGTYYQPKKDEFPATGVAGEDGFTSFWEAQIYSQREWLKYIRELRRNTAAAE